ncbi:MAG: hypothetical protein B6I26_05045 [Desulfobacteraceae bacterium 4572_130]|nr:MAG: hypothetical protein B6I26_05045 [Desulfobacteraceae bacterium 4572_130]
MINNLLKKQRDSQKNIILTDKVNAHVILAHREHGEQNPLTKDESNALAKLANGVLDGSIPSTPF